MILDFSQYKTWSDCPRKWYNQYVAKVEPIPTRLQSDSALTLGSLVHSGLENILKHRRVHIDDECVKDCNPTPQCFADALHLLNCYMKTMTSEPYIVSHIEE